MAFSVYFLKCFDDSLYIGQTDNLEVRVAQHHDGYFKGCYTYKRRPLVFLRAFEFPTRIEALEAERIAKAWSRAKKWAFINNDATQFRELSKSTEQRRREAKG